MAAIFEDYPPTLTPEQLDHVLATIKDWSIARGLAVRPPPDSISSTEDLQSVAAIPAPVTLFPSLFPKHCYEEAIAVATIYNELYARISMDDEWLGTIIQELIEVDDFIEKLWQIHIRVKKEGYVQPLSLGLFRSDYMIHDHGSANFGIKQVEFNTISSSFGGLSTQVSSLHEYLYQTQAYGSNTTTKGLLPSNKATKDLASGLGAAYNAYTPLTSFTRCVLFVVQDPERNIFDQRHLEYALQDDKITTFRLPVASTLKHVQVDEEHGKALIYAPPHLATRFEVAVVYFRSTYAPSDFASDHDWEARYQLERSAAIKCPSILTHLAGSKKIQQVLATPLSTHLGKFLAQQEVEQIKKSFTAIYPLDNSEAGKQAKAIATDPEQSAGYVLKPQREGGGNNVYRKAIPEFLKSLGDESKWRGHILMELIEPPSQRNSIFRGGLLKSGEVIAELGVFGTCLWDSKGKILRNEEAGYLLRTKGRESEEGGVAAGFGAIDSVCLLEV